MYMMDHDDVPLRVHFYVHIMHNPCKLSAPIMNTLSTLSNPNKRHES